MVRPPSAAALSSAVALGAALLLSAPPGVTAQRYVDNILISRSGKTSTVQIALSCPMRLESSRATEGGTVVEIHLGPLDECRDLENDGSASEAYRPAGGSLANLTQVEYDSLGVGQSFVVLHFDQVVDYQVAQSTDLRSLQLSVRSPAVAQPEEVVTPMPAANDPPARAAGGAADHGARGRAPLTEHVVAPKTDADYIVNLQSTRNPVPAELIASLPAAARKHLYISNIEVDGTTWHRLRLGFFASEAAATDVLTPLKKRFPRAWVGRAEPREVRAVSAQGFSRGGSIDTGSTGGALSSTAAARPAQADGAAVSATAATATLAKGPSSQPLGSGPATALFAQARSATLDGDFDKAIRLYTRLLRAPGTQQAKARELLGVAYEKNGQAAQAEAEYRAYLKRYPSGDGADRVRQRLNGLLTAKAAPREPLRRTTTRDVVADRAQWKVTSGLSQYYRHDAQKLDQSQNQTDTLSALLSDLDLNVSRTGGNLDVLGRFTVNHFYDLLNNGQFGTGTRSRVYYAYVDLASATHGWSMRFGRQSLHHWGVLGRFDGAHFTYQWAPDRRVHVMTGSPVASLYSSLSTTQRFAGAAVDFDHLIGKWNWSGFVNRETVDGINDRQAVGFEVSYRDQHRSLNGIVDYDIGYGKLNSVLTLATWQLPSRMTLTMLLDLRKSPVLTTSNALIGQPVMSIDQLLLSFTEDQIRQLAIDRTAQSKTTTLGIAQPLGQRFQLNADVTVTQLDGTVASGGVPALPNLGTQTFYSTSLVGSGLFGGNDVTVFNLRHGRSDAFTTDSLTWDARFALGPRLRINPRLQFSVWKGVLDGAVRETLSPSLRLLVNLHNRYHLELEAGTSKLTRTQSGSESIATGNYFDLGYRADF